MLSQGIWTGETPLAAMTVILMAVCSLDVLVKRMFCSETSQAAAVLAYLTAKPDGMFLIDVLV